MDEQTLPAAPGGRRAGVRYSQKLARALCARVAAGESLASVCADPAMPGRWTLAQWARARPAFAEALTRAKAAGGRSPKGGNLSTYTEEVGREICERMCEGESIAAICRDPTMPSFSTVYLWRRSIPEFAAAVRIAREVQAERFCDLGWELACEATPETAYLTQVRLAQLRWTAAVLAPRRYGRLRPQAAEDAEGGERPELNLLIRRFEIEVGEDGARRVVAWCPDPDTGEAVRETVGRGR